MAVGIDSALLLSIYQSRAGLGSLGAGSSALAGTSLATKQYAPTAPWSATPTAAQISARVASAMAGTRFIDEGSAKLDLSGASSDYKKLFALYQGLGTLQDVAGQINGKNVNAAQKAQINAAFTRGLAEISKYVTNAELEKLRLTQGAVDTSEKAALKVTKAAANYVTPPLVKSSTAEVPAFMGNVKFDISIKRVNTTANVTIDLSLMSGTRTIGNVVNFINDQIAATGLSTRFASTRQPGQPQTITAGGKTITLPATSDQWAMTVTAGTSEVVSFVPTATAGAVYVAQSIGDPDPDKNSATNDSRVQQQLLKFQTDTTNVDAPLQVEGQANFVDGRAFANTLGPKVGTVHATQVGPDGAVYVLADVTGLVSGQTIRGEQDVALMKYDSAGKLLYTRTLGASESATGLGLAVSATGQVAIAGSVKGGLDGAVNGALNSGVTGTYAGQTDSFVTVFDPSGQELWTARRGARKQDEASQVSFGADGTVYVAGRSESSLPGQAALGGWDGYIEAFKADAKGVPKTLFTQSVGSAGNDKVRGMAVDGNVLVTASVEDGRAVLRRFDISGAAPVLVNTLDAGDLQGGDLVGVAIDGGKVIVAGSTANASLSTAAVKNPSSGGIDAFVLKVNADLTPAASDVIAYYGGSGDDRATSLAVSNGQVWIGGRAGTDLPGQPPVGTKDGFLANLDVDNGAIAWSRRFTGKDGQAAPTAIAIAPTGASILDRLGLPAGVMNPTASQQLTAVSSIRAGGTFTVAAGGGVAKTITIDAAETLDTLATKIQRASGQAAKVTISTISGVRQMTIVPATGSAVITFGAGKGDTDVLAQLGIDQGILRKTTTINDKVVPADGGSQIYGLGLPSDINLSDKDQISHALATIGGAMGVVRKAYQGLVDAATPQAVLDARARANAAASGPVPAYLTAQLANYQAGLARLTGSS